MMVGCHQHLQLPLSEDTGLLMFRSPNLLLTPTTEMVTMTTVKILIHTYMKCYSINNLTLAFALNIRANFHA